ncbi:DDE family endonuclease [Favolaschia claudopus]|uniref:DDE family endonuclease n=1 Tax=Favolaschia claudopus TaxID=2862362 RepID=A0AAW0EL37_9AGAR
MPRRVRNTSHSQRGADGKFTSNQTLSEPDSDSDDNGWESDSSSESEPVDDPDYFEAWDVMPTPRTYAEREEIREQKREKAAAKRRKAEMRSAEFQEAGPTEQTGKKRGPYTIGGLSKRRLQEKKKKLRDDFKSGQLDISKEELDRQIVATDVEAAPSKTQSLHQTSILNMFSKAAPKKRLRAPSFEVQEVSESSSSSKRPRTGSVSMATSPALSSVDLRAEEEEDESESDSSDESEPVSEVELEPEQIEEEARDLYGDEAVDSVAEADDVAEWVEILEDAAPPEPDRLQALAADCLRIARKQHDYRSEVLFAALVDFYRWMGRMGRLRAALRVAKNHGRGVSFQRVLAAQARFFESSGTLKPSHQGQREKSNGLLDDEGFYMGVQRWLRTLEPGTVNPKLLQRHINETLLPSLSLKKQTVSVRHCQRWLWRLGYRRKRYHKGVYWDGHERKDVKKRRKEYLAELKEFEEYRATYAEPDMKEILPELQDGEVEHIVIVHDESSFHSNDYQNNHYWLKANEQILKKKGRGRLIMVSAFLCEHFLI